jgi:hypothetical protein
VNEVLASIVEKMDSSCGCATAPRATFEDETETEYDPSPLTDRYQALRFGKSE